MLKKNLPWATKDSAPMYNESKPDDLTPFGFLKSLQGVLPVMDFSREEVQKAYSPFMMNRIVSMNPTFLALANEINMYADVPRDQHYKYYESFIPKKSFFFPYIKKDKDREEIMKENVAKYFECGTRDLVTAMKILTEEQKNAISEKYEVCGLKR